jgi:5-methylcytosine-specific restriction endonuclease McrA
MPIKPENRSKYPTDWLQIRDRILEREGHCCKFCKVPNHIYIARSVDGRYYMLASGEARDASTGEQVAFHFDEFPTQKWIEVVLTVAHLDHDPTNNADENLAALCQRCHNRHDVPQRVESRRKTRERKAAVPLS